MTPFRSSEQRHYLQDTFVELPDRSVAQTAVQTLGAVFTKTDTCPSAQCDYCTWHEHPQCLSSLLQMYMISWDMSYRKRKKSKLIKEIK